MTAAFLFCSSCMIRSQSLIATVIPNTLQHAAATSVIVLKQQNALIHECRPYGKCYPPITYCFRISFPKVTNTDADRLFRIDKVTVAFSECPLHASLLLSAEKHCLLVTCPSVLTSEVAKLHSDVLAVNGKKAAHGRGPCIKLCLFLQKKNRRVAPLLP